VDDAVKPVPVTVSLEPALTLVELRVTVDVTLKRTKPE
jgi:hypothetical protein